VRRARARGDRAATLQSEGKRVCTYGSFQSAVLRVLDPNGHTHVLLHHSWWTTRGRNLSQREHMRVMGFPDTYVFPEREARYTRAFLSRGVCPPVAQWLLEALARNLRGAGVGDVVRPGDVYDVRPARGWFAGA
jgi:site-specific DNA-cytosine methylase